MILTGSKRFFSWKKAYAIIFCKVSSDLKPFWQVTIFHTRLPHKPNHGLGLKQGWNSEKLTKMIFTGSKRFFSWKKAYAIIFAKFQVISSHFDKLPYFTRDFPKNQIMDWDLDKGEILKTYKNEFDWLKTIFFHEKRHTRSFLQSFKWFQAILTSYHISH